MFSGVLVNSAAIILGGCLGAILRNISEEMKDTVTKGIGLGVVALGIQIAIQTKSFTIVIVSLCIGAMVGELFGIENGMNRLGLFLEKRFARSNSNFAEGFVTASLIFVIGSIESGVSGNHATLYTKAVMDIHYVDRFFRCGRVIFSRTDFLLSRRNCLSCQCLGSFDSL